MSNGSGYDTTTHAMGGPPVQSYFALQDSCTGSNQVLINDLQSALDCACEGGGNDKTSLCQAVWAGTTWSQIPFKSLIDVINNNSTCKSQLTPATKNAAYKAFTSVTGYEPLNMDNVFDTIQAQTFAMVKFAAFYIFIPIMLLILVGLWLMVGVGWIGWGPALYLSLLSFIVLYGFSILFRVHAQLYLNEQLKSLKNLSGTYNSNFQSTIAYLPQGLFAVASSVASNGHANAWTCNNNPPNNSSHRLTPKSCRNGVCGADPVTEDDSIDDITPPTRKRKSTQKRNR